jgi:alkaline phosphatase
MTEVAIDYLQKIDTENKGFFIMVEGGKIDWACHANDAVATIGDMIDFDDAVGKALAFYDRNPDDTLIVVTGDHETGGMTIGHATTAYTAYYDRLLGQTNSFTYFGANQWAEHKAANSKKVCRGKSYLNHDDLADDMEMRALMNDVFGLDYAALNDYQKEKLEDAYDKSMCGSNDNSDDKNAYLYGSYEPIIVTITHILNENASIGWTSYSHTGVPVPLFAQGDGAETFGGFYDNTDIAKKLAQVMSVGSLPQVK